MAEVECPECHGMRLKKESLSYKIWDKNMKNFAEIKAVLFFDGNHDIMMKRIHITIVYQII